ncbi:MAG TPA: AMP-binding protein [Kofleriaceae bacterium]|nr:AMP-binding protein [Kofleriaceae bacterium]
MTRLDDIAARGARRVPDRPAIVVPRGAGQGGTMTYAQLDRAASTFARAMRARGASPGDRLVLANANTPEFFVALFGAARAGLVAVPLDAGLAPPELANVLGHARPHAVVVDARCAATFEALGAPVCTVPAAATAPAEVADSHAADTDGGDAALILYTSGTTSTPRGVAHSHAAVLRKVEDIRAWFGLGESDRELCLLPTHFGHGLVCSCLTTLHFGGTLVLCRPFDATLLPRVFALADEHGVTTFSTVPTIIRLMLRNPAIQPPVTGRLRFVTCASAPLHADEVEAFEARFGVPLLNCYGLTEAGTWSVMSAIDPRRDRRSIGTAVGCRVRAVAVEGDQRMPLPAGEIGELELSGPSVMLGYDGAPEATAHVLRDGWLATGDLGCVDDRGRVFLAGRTKDLIIRAGANIYPSEIEGVLLRHPEVAEAYVVGLDHAVLGEQVAACVVRKDGARASEADLIHACRSVLTAYKCPETIRFVAAVPKTSRGKVSRAVLRALFDDPKSEQRPEPLAPRAWSTIDDLLVAVLHGTVPRAQLQAFIVAQWNARRFAFHAEAMAAWLPHVAALAERAGVTHHGRPEQPVCPSRHLFGDRERVAARVVFDPPSSPERPEIIEFHTHPVDSLIAVLGGGGSYLVCHQNTAGRAVIVDVPLEAGSVVCFPRDVVHTIECGPQGIETLNITDRLNQPAWRDDPALVNTGPVASPDFARAVEPPAGAPTIPYAELAAAGIPGLL